VWSFEAFNTTAMGSFGPVPRFSAMSINDYSHHLNLVWHIDASLEISLDFNASKKSA